MPPKRKAEAEASSSAGPAKKPRSANRPTEVFHMRTRRRAKSSAPPGVAGGEAASAVAGAAVGEPAVVEDPALAPGGDVGVEEAGGPAAVEEARAGGGAGEVEGEVVGGEAAAKAAEEVVEEVLAPQGPKARGRARGGASVEPAGGKPKRRGRAPATQNAEVVRARMTELETAYKAVAKAVVRVDVGTEKRTGTAFVMDHNALEITSSFVARRAAMAKRRVQANNAGINMAHNAFRSDWERNDHYDHYGFQYGNVRETPHTPPNNLPIQRQPLDRAGVLGLIKEDSNATFVRSVAKQFKMVEGEVINAAREQRQKNAGKQMQTVKVRIEKPGKPYSKSGFIKHSRTDAGRQEIRKMRQERELRTWQFEMMMKPSPTLWKMTPNM